MKKNNTTCKEKCCFKCQRSVDCPHKCGEATDKDCVGVAYNDCPNFLPKDNSIAY
jgi:hypothetical protein